jgi:hypothetical protein
MGVLVLTRERFLCNPWKRSERAHTQKNGVKRLFSLLESNIGFCNVQKFKFACFINLKLGIYAFGFKKLLAFQGYVLM